MLRNLSHDFAGYVINTKYRRHTDPNGGYDQNEIKQNNSVLFRFGHIHRSDQCAVYILYSKISTDPGLLKIRHSHRFVAVVIQFLIPYVINTAVGLEDIGCR